MFRIQSERIFPVLPRPPELKVTQMVGEPSDKSIKTSDVHRFHPLVEQFCRLCQDLGHGTGLQFAQLDQDGSVSQLDEIRIGQAKQFTKHHFDDHVLQRNLVFQWVTQ